MNVIDRVINALEIRRKPGSTFANHFAETVNRERIDRAKDRVGEVFCGSLLERQVMTRAQASVDRESDRQWERRFFVEDRDFLLSTILLENEVFFCEATHRRSMRVGHGH